MSDGVTESGPFLSVFERMEDEDEDEEDEVEVAGEEWTLTHHPPLLATLPLGCSWRGRLERGRRRRRSLELTWRRGRRGRRGSRR